MWSPGRKGRASVMVRLGVWRWAVARRRGRHAGSIDGRVTLGRGRWMVIVKLWLEADVGPDRRETLAAWLCLGGQLGLDLVWTVCLG